MVAIEQKTFDLPRAGMGGLDDLLHYSCEGWNGIA